MQTRIRTAMFAIFLLITTVVVADAQGGGQPANETTHCHHFEGYGDQGQTQAFSFCSTDIDATAPPTSTVAPLPTATSVASPTPVATSTTIPTSGFAATFDANVGLERFRTGVYHRDDVIVSQTSWPGDHDLDCGPPSTSRRIDRENYDDYFYMCRNHLMTSVGDTSGYSIAWFSPDQEFDSVSEVCWSVNLTTEMGNRQWWKVAVLSVDAPEVMSEVGASGLTGIEGPDRAIASWGGVGGAPGKLRIGNEARIWFDMVGGDDKATRYPACFRDNGNGSLTFEMRGPKDGGAITTEEFTVAGSFPDGPLKVVFQDHNYTPTKSDNGVGEPAGYTWHWDNIVITE